MNKIITIIGIVILSVVTGTIALALYIGIIEDIGFNVPWSMELLCIMEAISVGMMAGNFAEIAIRKGEL